MIDGWDIHTDNEVHFWVGGEQMFRLVLPQNGDKYLQIKAICYPRRRATSRQPRAYTFSNSFKHRPPSTRSTPLSKGGSRR